MSLISQIPLGTIACIKDIVLMSCAVIGTSVAAIGLNTWKKQLTWSHENNLKRKILIELYRLENSIESLRTPKVTTINIDPNSNLTINEQSFNSFADRYTKEWNEVIEHRNSLRSLLPEARATWGPKIRDIFDKLEAPLKELNWAIHEQIEACNPKTDRITKDELHKESKQRTAILFRKLDSDSFRDKIENYISAVEQYLEKNKK